MCVYSEVVDVNVVAVTDDQAVHEYRVTTVMRVYMQLAMSIARMSCMGRYTVSYCKQFENIVGRLICACYTLDDQTAERYTADGNPNDVTHKCAGN